MKIYHTINILMIFENNVDAKHFSVTSEGLTSLDSLIPTVSTTCTNSMEDSYNTHLVLKRMCILSK